MGPSSHSAAIPLDRRDLLRRAAALAALPLLGGCRHDRRAGSGLGWGPSLLAPVFYGHQDVTYGGNRARVFYPSTDGSPDGAPVLTGPGHFPLVLFLHGQCAEPDHYRRWFSIPSVLARCGFVVAVPELLATVSGTYPWADPHPDVDRVTTLLAWMRAEWEHRAILMSPPATAMAGHSYGALLGGRIVAASPGTYSAYASVSGVWTDGHNFRPNPLPRLGVPVLHMHGGDDDVFAVLSPAAWSAVPAPRFRLRYANAAHFDYVARPACDSTRGPCTLTGALAADFTAVFLSKYVWPEESGILPGFIEDNLDPPRPSLTTRQQFYVGGHLAGMTQAAARPGCVTTVEWNADSAGTRTLGRP